MPIFLWPVLMFYIAWRELCGNTFNQQWRIA